MSRSNYKLPVINQKIDNNLNKETNINLQCMDIINDKTSGPTPGLGNI